MSSTSSRFSFNHLIASPPPSPSLPALVPRHGKPQKSPRSRRYLRLAVWLAGVSAILYFGYTHIQLSHSVPTMGWMQHNDGKEYEMVGEDKLPDFPTPVVASDKRGRAKWTVSIPPGFEFPLEPETYSEICRQNMEASKHVADLHKQQPHGHYDYYHVDPYFVDVKEAEDHGMLPSMAARAGSKNWQSTNTPLKSMVGENADELVTSEVCSTTMTFVMETHDAGLGNTLMMLWMAYGLARREGRAFFVDDSRWYVTSRNNELAHTDFTRAYGKYTDYFKPPPLPSCRPPPRHEILPCPHHARHLVVSAATAPWTFGANFNDEFEDPRKMEVFRQKPMFDMARNGYENLFKLTDHDTKYVDERIDGFLNKTVAASGMDAESGIVIGIHVRHGDVHPLEYQYQDSYLPLEKYGEAARDLLHDRFNSSGPGGGEDLMAEMKSIFVVASDDPEVYTSGEFSHAYRAQDVILLASKKGETTPRQDIPGSMFKRFIDETVGWEGGFFAPMFWTLGRTSAAPGAVVEKPNTMLPPTAEAHRLRELVGRAYLLDLSILGQSTDFVVCGVSAMGCKLLAVMMGWERAIESKSWVNIDGQFDWKGVPW